jgi:DNA-binding MarR family transcriptional regulator
VVAGGARLDELARAARRDHDASRVTIDVLKASSRLSQALERALADVDLTLPQFNVLMELAASSDGSFSQRDVIDRLISTPSNLSWLTTRMRDLGLLTKDRDDDDARVVVLRITEAGWAALQEAMPRVFATERQLWGEHARGELRALADLLEPLLRPGEPRDTAGPRRPPRG